MLTSVNWINAYLDTPADAEEQAELLTRAGFPLEHREEIEGDVRQDFEMTSNRGDCTSHLGLAREIVAFSERSLRLPSFTLTEEGPPTAEAMVVENTETGHCPLYTARIIRGITIGPSPDWLAERLVARGDIPRNNVVDATNFVLHELGQPTHIFDLAKIQGQKIIVRMARDQEAFLPIGDGAAPLSLTPEDLVIADAETAVALAGVKGGADTAVNEGTVDILIEAATFSPLSVRESSRRHRIASDSSFRFERGVHPDQIDMASARLAALILDIAGGTLDCGVLSEGAPGEGTYYATGTDIAVRCDRARKILGIDISNEEILDSFSRLGFDPVPDGDVITCSVPVHRLDLQREIDFIEEVARVYGMDRIPMRDELSLRISMPVASEQARRVLLQELAGMGLLETMTHTLITPSSAALFLLPGREAMRVEDDRAKATPLLRPSLLPSLLRVASTNADKGNKDVRLFELATAFSLADGDGDEQTMLSILHPASAESNPLHETRGMIERVIAVLAGPGAPIAVEETEEFPWFQPGAEVRVHDLVLGRYGMLTAEVTGAMELEGSWVGVELFPGPLLDHYPPPNRITPGPGYPAIERDLSIIVDEGVRWLDVQILCDGLSLEFLEATEYVTTFRDGPIPPGKKSLTLRLRFRSGDRTLTREEVEPQVSRAIHAATKTLGAEIRA